MCGCVWVSVVQGRPEECDEDCRSPSFLDLRIGSVDGGGAAAAFAVPAKLRLTVEGTSSVFRGLFASMTYVGVGIGGVCVGFTPGVNGTHFCAAVK